MGGPRRAEGRELLNGVGVGAGSGSQEVLVSGTRILKMRCRFDAAVAIPVWTQAKEGCTVALAESLRHASFRGRLSPDSFAKTH